MVFKHTIDGAKYVKYVKRLIFSLVMCLILTESIFAEQAPPYARAAGLVKPMWFYGGGLGLSSGSVQYFEVSPLVGYYLNRKTTLGISFLYRYRNDKRFTEDYSTTDYGATLFARYNLTSSVYLQAEYEYINYEIGLVDMFGNVVSLERTDFSSVLVGGGLQKPLSTNASLYLTVLYNLNYDANNSPYNDPVSYRFGIGIGF